jgi:CRISPR-associated protein Cas5d
MPTDISHTIRIQFWGKYACFTRPEMKVERVSYPMMTPSAARGSLESIFWKPQMAWRIERIDRLRPPVFQQVRRNEVELKASVDRSGIVIDRARQQRAALILRDVAYVVHARIALTSSAAGEDTIAKYVAIFRRRAGRGQCFQRPCLGTREFAADFQLIDENDPDPGVVDAPADENLGWMFYDFDWSHQPPQARFFEARLAFGRMAVPPAGGARACP